MLDQIKVLITGDGAKLTSALNTASSQIAAFGKRATTALAGVSTQMKLLGGASLYALGRQINNTIDAWDELYKASQKTGVAVDQLAKLRYAADLAGVDSQQLSQALKFLNQTLGEAAAGSEQATADLAALGIAVGDDVYTAFLKAADAIAGMKDPAARAAALSAVFKKSWDGLVPLLNDGAGAIKAAGDELERMGGVPTQAAAKAAQELNDNITRLKNAAIGPFNEAMKSLLPTLEAVSTSFVRASQSSDGFADSMAKMFFFGTGKEGLQRELAYQYQMLEGFRKKLAELREQEARGEFPLFGGTEKLYSQIQEYERTIVEIRQRIADNLEAQKQIDLKIGIAPLPNAPQQLAQDVSAVVAAAQASVQPIVVPIALGTSGAVGSYADLKQEFLRQQEGMATGGAISGPGTSTSDSILARLSTGEYVVRASAVRAYGRGLLDAINAKRFNVGGVVGAPPGYASGGEVSFAIDFGGRRAGVARTSSTEADMISRMARRAAIQRAPR